MSEPTGTAYIAKAGKVKLYRKRLLTRKGAAKFSRGLIRHIYRHLLDDGLVRPGDTILDPFGGVALGALDAQAAGLAWIGVELEPRFVDLGCQNLALWQSRYKAMPRWSSRAALLQGDSRELGKVIQGQVGAVVSSPPYAALHVADGEAAQMMAAGNGRSIDDSGGGARYGSTPGQLGALPPGDFDAVVSSPPYEAINVVHITSGIMGNNANPLAPDGTSQWKSGDYGTTPGQLGAESPDTFWSSARAIVAQCYQVLKPGGVAVWVVKAFVRNKAIVDFPGQWRALCEAAGFETLHEHRAWLIEERGTQFDLDGNGHRKRTERKSFFRRLAESKGSPRIDWETVLCMRRAT